MTMLRTIAFMVLCIVALPFVLLNGMGVGRADLTPGAVAGHAAQGRAEIAGLPLSAQDGADRDGLLNLARATRTRERRHISAVFDPDTLSPKRVVRFDTRVAFDELLAPGEPRPDPSLHALYAEARASGHLMRECAAMLRVFASRCAVSFSVAQDLGDGIWQLSGSLSFTPSDPIGDIPRGAELEYTPWRTRLLIGNRGLRIPQSDIAQTREGYYRRARDVCAAIRRASGNCIIESISFSAAQIPGTPEVVSLSARAKFATLALAGGGGGGDSARNGPADLPLQGDEPDGPADLSPPEGDAPLGGPTLNVRLQPARGWLALSRAD